MSDIKFPREYSYDRTSALSRSLASAELQVCLYSCAVNLIHFNSSVESNDTDDVTEGEKQALRATMTAAKDFVGHTRALIEADIQFADLPLTLNGWQTEFLGSLVEALGFYETQYPLAPLLLRASYEILKANFKVGDDLKLSKLPAKKASPRRDPLTSEAAK